MTCGDASKWMLADLSIPALAGVNRAKQGRSLFKSSYRGYDEEDCDKTTFDYINDIRQAICQPGVDFKFNIICLQECWLSEQIEYNCIQLPGCDCVTQGRTCSASGGLITYVDHSFQHEIISNINKYTLWESLILRIKGGGLPKGLIIGNIYRPPRMLKDEIKQFINELHYLYYPLKNIDSMLT